MNPFYKYLTKEDHLHRAILVYCEFQYPNCFLHHSPNEGKRSKFERFKAKYLGMDKGFPDLIWLDPNKGYNGLALEVKVIYDNGAKNKPSKYQIDKIDKLENRNWFVKVIWTFDEAKKIIDWYFN